MQEPQRRQPWPLAALEEDELVVGCWADEHLDVILAFAHDAGIAETQEMLDFCGEHNIVSEIEIIKMQDINEAYERMLKCDVRYRFVIDMASLK